MNALLQVRFASLFYHWILMKYSNIVVLFIVALVISDPCDTCPEGTICEKRVNPCLIPPCPVSVTCRDPDPCSVCPKGTLCRREPRFCINPPCGPDFVRCLDPDNVCSLEPETGPCRGGFRKFFYNSTTDQCELFIYGGCGGNDNRFDTRSECISACGE